MKIVTFISFETSLKNIITATESANGATPNHHHSLNATNSYNIRAVWLLYALITRVLRIRGSRVVQYTRSELDL